MKREDFDRALQNLDQDLLNEVAEKRHHNLYESKKTAKNPKKKPFFSPARISAIAAVLCFAVLTVAIYPVLQNHPFVPPEISTTGQGHPVTTPAPMTTYETTAAPTTTVYHTTVPFATTTYRTTVSPVTTVVATTAATTPDTTKVTVTEETTSATPQDYETVLYPERFSEIISGKPYFDLIPSESKIPYAFSSAIFKENEFLEIQYYDGGRTAPFTIRIGTKPDGSHPVNLHDPKSYDISYYYDPEKKATSETDVFGYFQIEDVTKEMLQYRTYRYVGGYTLLDMEIHYRGYYIHYRYDGTYATDDFLWSLPASAPYFQKNPVETTRERPPFYGTVVEETVETTAKKESLVSQVVEVTTAPYAEEYVKPTYQEICKEEPYRQVLPRNILFARPADFTVQTKGKIYFSAQWTDADNDDFFSITVYDKPPIAYHVDVTDPLSYDISYYYDPIKHSILPKKTNPFGYFTAEELTKDIINARTCKINGVTVGKLTIVCGSYTVHYVYRGGDLPEDAFYDMVVSSPYFQNLP